MNVITGRYADALLSLYPIRWRERYETEFRDLLSECPLSLATILDTCRGALDAHLHFGAAARRRAAIQKARTYRTTFVTLLLLWRAPVAVPTTPCRPPRSLLG